MGISENIKRLRTEKGWTQEELEKMVDHYFCRSEYLLTSRLVFQSWLIVAL